ncbi:MAG: phosphatidylglycerophosphatase A [Elusimicrobiota bacterium]
MRKKILIALSSGFGTGYSPAAPGTFGTLLASILYLLVMPRNIYAYCTVVVILGFAAVFISAEADKIYESEDNPRIVIDEIAGLWVTMAFIPKTVEFLVIGFVLFRFFDVVKPLYIRQIQKLNGGWGIVADDVLAGIYSNIILQVLLRTWLK